MGMSSGGGGGTSKTVSSDINVTPLIDVLLVLLIIFLVVMPIMMKMETLQVPRKINENEQPDPNASQLTIKVKASGEFAMNDGSSENDSPLPQADIASTVAKKLKAMSSNNEKVVFVEFEDAVTWETVVTTMDTIRSVSNDENHDEVKVALKVKEDKAGATP